MSSPNNILTRSDQPHSFQNLPYDVMAEIIRTAKSTEPGKPDLVMTASSVNTSLHGRLQNEREDILNQAILRRADALAQQEPEADLLHQFNDLVKSAESNQLEETRRALYSRVPEALLNHFNKAAQELNRQASEYNWDAPWNHISVRAMEPSDMCDKVGIREQDISKDLGLDAPQDHDIILYAGRLRDECLRRFEEQFPVASQIRNSLLRHAEQIKSVDLGPEQTVSPSLAGGNTVEEGPRRANAPAQQGSPATPAPQTPAAKALANFKRIFTSKTQEARRGIH
jgi:hypothetical protein